MTKKNRLFKQLATLLTFVMLLTLFGATLTIAVDDSENPERVVKATPVGGANI